jgi:hypothetical protein
LLVPATVALLQFFAGVGCGPATTTNRFGVIRRGTQGVRDGWSTTPKNPHWVRLDKRIQASRVRCA